ncbi:hypothetical protein [Sphingomonas changnyeongensis]|nr:hypothetical protein [Sphingomonas changnyeongensis]
MKRAIVLLIAGTLVSGVAAFAMSGPAAPVAASAPAGGGAR